MLGGTSAVLIRNPIGICSLASMAFGGLLLVDAFAKRASAQIMQLLHSVNPQLAIRIRSKPGGHDGTRHGL